MNAETLNRMTADEAQQAIVDEFSLLGDWNERYQYLIDLGRRLPPFPERWRDEAHKVKGCQSQVWMAVEPVDGVLHIHATSDALIVSGLIALLLRVYNDRPAAEITATRPWFVAALGLGAQLSPTRSNGLAAMLARIQELAHQTQPPLAGC